MSVFDSIPSRPQVKKKEFKTLEPSLRHELVTVQRKLRKARVPVMIVFAGVDGAGKHEMANCLQAWMDPRWMITRAYDSPFEEERQRPPFWRYWRDTPASGQIGLYLSAWYSQPLVNRVRRLTTPKQFRERLDEIARFERTLKDNGILLIKIWLHLDREAQYQRLEGLSKSPKTEWRLKPGAWENWGLYDRFIVESEKIIQTSEESGDSWLIINGKHEYTRIVQVARALLGAARDRLDNPPVQKGLDATAWNQKMKKTRGRLSAMNLNRALPQARYKKELRTLQRRLVQLQHQAQVRDLSTVLVFEGQDAAGKGGAIRRLVQGLDSRRYQVIPIAAPTDEELAHHYLWRFWRHLPRSGRVTIFDRSWYGRVLVERLEGFADPAAWQRAYEEINEFEHQLADHGMVVCKFWLQIDKDEQLRRFRLREKTPYKSWKLTEEDWRNRKKWKPYQDAANDMITLTNHRHAPWILVEGNDKNHARIKVLRTVCRQLKNALDR